MTHCSKSVPAAPLSKHKFQQRLADAWTRVVGKLGNQPTMAGAMGMNDTAAIKRVVAQDNLPSAHTIFNSLCADMTALDEVLAEYGLQVVPKHAEAANDMQLVSGLSDGVSEFIRRLADGKRCHVDTAILAELFRNLIPQMQAIVLEHDGRRAA